MARHSSPRSHARRGSTRRDSTSGTGPGTGANTGASAMGGPPTRLYGKHAVFAALSNPRRHIRTLWVTPDMRDALAPWKERLHRVEVHVCHARDLGRLLGDNSPHQGVLIDVDPLPPVHIEDILTPVENTEGNVGPIVILDQVTDPHNVGAILRSAAAFGALALVTQDRHAPLEGGALAKAASGALEHVPWVRVTNLARTLDDLSTHGFWRIMLDGDAKRTFAESMDGARRVAFILGAEGHGIRPNVAARSDDQARLPMTDMVESLNVSNAAAIALYIAATRAG